LPTVIVKTQVGDYASIVNLEVDGRRRRFRGIDCLLQSCAREWLTVHRKYFHPRAETCLIGNFAHQDIGDHAVYADAHGKGILKVFVSDLRRQSLSVRISPQRHLHEYIGTAIRHWRKALRFHVAKANRFV